MKIKRKIVEIDRERCNGCGQCVSACAEGAIELIDGKAKLISDKYCDGLAACLGECPEGAIKITEREAETFDPEAVEHHLKHKEDFQILTTHHSTLNAEVLPCGCPSTHIQMFSSPCKEANQPVSQKNTISALTHWPVQIKLVPPTAPFLKGAHILVAADCTPVAYPNFHSDFLKGRIVLIGCPKFDNTEEYVNKFAEIFKLANIQNVTVLTMEVPCCSKLPAIIRQGMEIAGKNIPMEVIVSTRGKIL
ncbi:MAG: 4Fe-4S binding protein [Proteobacteria bacterium]|nr:4Fe-4S binding protein [Pseudomonadota bacterium]